MSGLLAEFGLPVVLVIALAWCVSGFWFGFVVCGLSLGLVILWCGFLILLFVGVLRVLMVCTLGGGRFGADFCCLVWLGFGVCRFVVFWFGVLGVVSGVLHGLVCIGLRIFMFACR